MLKQFALAVIASAAFALPAIAAPATPAPSADAAATKADMEKARAEREAGKAPEPPAKNTTIQQVRDQNNRVVEYIVTPGSTHIPYTIENRSERPADDTPGGNPKSTTGTTRQIHFGW